MYGRIRLCAIGFGNRTGKYLKYVEQHPEEAAICAVVDIDMLRLKEASELYSIPEDRCFPSVDELLASGIEADAAIVATADDSHYDIALKVLERGWHLLLEKPMARTSGQCVELADAAERSGVVSGLCYVMRYHPYYRRIKEIADSGNYGKILSVTHRENVGIDRMTHTFIRGHWSREGDTSPIFISKCCHDVDFLLWMAGDRVSCDYSVASKGRLSKYCAVNFPERAASRCIDCPLEEGCRYSAVDLYRRRKEWTGNFGRGKNLDEAIEKELRYGKYGRCVYRCDNDVMDCQETVFEFVNGVKIGIVLDGISDKEGRDTVICFERGRLVAKDGVISVFVDGNLSSEEDFTGILSGPFHGGADLAIVEDFFRAIRTGIPMECSLSGSLAGCIACFAAERSRKAGGKVINQKSV